MTSPLKFQPGTIVMTIGAQSLLKDNQQLLELLRRHLSGDGGDLSEEDKKANEHAIKFGERVFSSYKLPSGEKLWIVTERDRSSTTVLTPSEY